MSESSTGGQYLMRGLRSGLIAGIISGILLSGSIILQTMMGVGRTMLSGIPLTLDLVMAHLAYAITLTGSFGAIYGIVYSRFCNRIQGRHIKKGLIFGLVVLLFSNITFASGTFLVWLFTSNAFHFGNTIVWTVAGFLTWIPYGVLLGVIYERWP